MSFLYVCHFSNGHVKVGRSIDPETRIASHAERVSCVGISLIEKTVIACLDRVEVREALLIERCAQNAVERHKNEWFTGLDYSQVCGWAADFAAEQIPFALAEPAPVRALDAAQEEDRAVLDWAIKCAGGVSKLAAAVDVRQNVVSNWRARRLSTPWKQVLLMKYGMPAGEQVAKSAESNGVDVFHAPNVLFFASAQNPNHP